VISVHDPDPKTAIGALARFGQEAYECFTARADVLFELTDAVLCTDGPVRSLVGLSLAPEHRRGHGALYDALNCGRIDIARLRNLVAAQQLPKAAGGRMVLAVDVTPWLRPDANTSPNRSFCHTYGRGKGSAEMIPGWPYSMVAALETGRTSWTALLDALRLTPGADVAAVTAEQVRDVVARLIAAGQWQDGDPDMLIVLDAGYDAPASPTCWLICRWRFWGGCARTGCCVARPHRAPRAPPGAGQPSTAGSSSSAIPPPGTPSTR
jgi:hypothetical protein